MHPSPDVGISFAFEKKKGRGGKGEDRLTLMSSRLAMVDVEAAEDDATLLLILCAASLSACLDQVNDWLRSNPSWRRNYLLFYF